MDETLERIPTLSTAARETTREPTLSRRGPFDAPDLELLAPTGRAPHSATNPGHSEAWEREQMLDRLRRLRRVLPALAQEMVAARRQAARLRTDNRRLSEQVRELRAELETRREHRTT